MTSTTEYGCGTTVDPDEPQEHFRTSRVAPGVYFTLQIVGDEETVLTGDQAQDVLGGIVAEQVNDLASHRYVFTHQVSRTLTVMDGDDRYTLTVDFTPTRRRDLRGGKSELSVLNAFDRALAAAHQAITSRATLIEQLENAPTVDVLVLIEVKPRRRRRFWIF